MSRFLVLLSCLAMLAFGLGLSGCGAPAESPPSQPDQEDAGAAHEHQHGEGAEHEHGEGADHQHGEDAEHEHGEGAEHTHGSTEVQEAFAGLSEEDRAAAEKQRICPVSGDALGAMGAPYKVTVKGRDVFLCCQGCEDAIKKDPDKYLAKLDE